MRNRTIATSLMLVCVVVLATSVVMGPLVAAGAEPGVAIGAGELAITGSPTDGWTTSAPVTNATDKSVDVGAKLTGKSCELTLSKNQVPAHQSLSIAVTIPKTCDVERGQSVSIEATVGISTATLVGKTPSSSEPDWSIMPIAFGGALVVSTIVLLLAWLIRDTSQAKFKDPVPGLDAKWSFQDSWAATATTAATLLTGIFASSDILTGILGDEPSAELALMLVAGALAVGLVGAAVLVTKIIATEDAVPLTLGVLLAGILTLTGVGGQLAVVGVQASRLSLGGVESYAIPIAIGAAILVLVYGARSIHGMLRKTDSGTEPPSEALVAAAAIALASSTPSTIRARAAVTLARDLEAAMDETETKLPADLLVQANVLQAVYDDTSIHIDEPAREAGVELMNAIGYHQPAEDGESIRSRPRQRRSAIL